MDIALASLLVFVIIFFVPIIIYGLFVKYFALKEPDKKARMFAGIIIQKLATTFGFVTLFVMAESTFSEHWLTYGIIWFAMFAVTEIGQTFLSDSSKKEAVAGIISETIYFPLAAFTVYSIL